MGMQTLLCCALVGVLAIFNQLLFNTGMQMTPAGLGLMMRNIDIVCAFFWQSALFHEPATMASLVGALLICAATIGSALRKLLQWKSQMQSAVVLASDAVTTSSTCSVASDVPRLTKQRPGWAWRQLKARWRTPLAQRGDSSGHEWAVEVVPPQASQPTSASMHPG
jgi:hypothetical protein